MTNENETPSFVPREWVGFGSLFCYGTVRPRSFVVRVEAASSVQGETLQQAVDKALERMPYYRQTIVGKGGKCYYANNDLPFLVAETRELRELGSAATNYHMIDVTYFESTIWFSMFHGLTDGLGFNQFIDAVLYHYFCLKDHTSYGDEGIVTERVPFDPTETVDPVLMGIRLGPRDFVQALKALLPNKRRFRLPEVDEPDGKGPLMHHLPLRVESGIFMSWCKAHATSPAAALSAILARAIAVTAEVENDEVECEVEFSARKVLGLDRTFKNCTTLINLPIAGTEAKSVPVGELAASMRRTMKENINETHARRTLGMLSLFLKLFTSLPIHERMGRSMPLVERFPQDTVSVDYVGSLKANGYGDQILDVRYLDADLFGGSLFVLFNEVAGHFVVSFNQTFASDRYFEALGEVLAECGLPYEMLPRETYLNPEVRIP